ncbi:uncharacterized protein TRAVEDRAFT_158128 [Trametes versicolor FP-101664 SS1]|uniref:uncharacterized protein n=1 Tax=Trametes versicolor (strain FP-101664) TaxID=717944 RepID=UPI0004621456|nr:uncharacterized protein TRAVEDRAFT_158128 [Trametes versicolor FP-101664 SS1]EIW64163.1 hypothetical protein TRAVEDRAFT_158128 [Trametes versicolor FP-101664 SS1]
MFTLNPGDAPVDGRSDEQPIALHDVSAADFERLLSLFYPRDVVSGDLSTLEQWTSVLRLTHIYEFEAHHALAVKRLAVLAPPIDRLLLSRQYDVPEWLEDAYYELCIREPSLTLEEGARLGLPEVVRIADLRQAIRVSARVHFPEHYIRGAIRQRLTG